MINLTSYAEKLDGKPVAVFGLGISGLATIEALLKAGVRVLAGDDNQNSLNEAQKLGAEALDLSEDVLKECAFLVLSPGVPLNFPEPHNIVKAARAAGIEIIGDVELLHRCAHGRKVIGVTGTNGKSTTTALIGHVLGQCGISVSVGGNLGQAVLSLDMPEEGGVFVLELSSYQLDLCSSFAPDIGVLLNITLDHIDRHGSFEAYKACKMHMIENAGIGIIENNNILAARQVAEIFGFSEDAIDAAIASFKGLAHRCEFVRQIGCVSYINDSKATNAEATIYALKNMENVYLIAGGLPKEGGLTGIEVYKDSIVHVFLIGESADDFSRWLDDQGVPNTICAVLDVAVERAHEMAQGKKGIVLLSPACASFDQYKSFEERGDAFKALVEGLEE